MDDMIRQILFYFPKRKEAAGEALATLQSESEFSASVEQHLDTYCLAVAAQLWKTRKIRNR
jgi:hypothetical protein